MGHGSHVFGRLRQQIVGLDLVPGTVLSRSELQERFGVSSTPVRDALLRLEEEGLVEIFPQHTTRVTLIDPAHARTGQFLRRSVETEVVRCLADAPHPAVVSRLDTLIRRQRAFADIPDVAAFMDADLAFHQALYEAAGVSGLWPVVRRQGGHIDRIRRLNLPAPGKMMEILADHEAITRAVAEKDHVRALAVLRSHLSRSLDGIETLRSAHPTFFRPEDREDDGRPTPEETSDRGFPPTGL
jgi:DNA-binding GntR family transcriptional regulator